MVHAKLAFETVDGELLLGYLRNGGVAGEGIDMSDVFVSPRLRLCVPNPTLPGPCG